ncbi:hypothetical protein [Nakamurella lactea]|uniref:hypothetical protein n=1 Tax=Nakamurella lactea TaxID=459515 RepID=UPI00042000AD|nr:hypothetical protein [Nakamurella lactea]
MVKRKYGITVAGQLGSAARTAFADLEIVPDPESEVTLLRGSLDQAGLFGVLHQIQSLAIILLEVRRLD